MPKREKTCLQKKIYVLQEKNPCVEKQKKKKKIHAWREQKKEK